MKALAKLKDDARKHEQKEEWERAIDAYVQVVKTAESSGELETELPLFNRIGDLFVRLQHAFDRNHGGGECFSVELLLVE